MTTDAAAAPAFEEARAALADGRTRAARLLIDDLAPRNAADVLFGADVLAATGAFRRGHALLRWGHKKFADDEELRVALARADLAQGLVPERRTRNLLEKQLSVAAVVLRARLENKPAVFDEGVERDAEVDADVALLTFAADPAKAIARAKTALQKTPSSSRTRLVLASLLRAHGQFDEGRAVLKEGARGFEDARVEVAHAFALVVDGKHEEAGLAVARLRARFPDLARDRTLRLLLTTLAWAADRRDDAATFVAGASDLLAAERAAGVFLAGGPPAAAAPAATSTMAPPPKSTPGATSTMAPPPATGPGASSTMTPPPKSGPGVAPGAPGSTPGMKPPPTTKAPLVDVKSFDADYKPPAAWRRPVAAVLLGLCCVYGAWRILQRVKPEVLVPFGYVIPLPDAGPPPAVDDLDAGPQIPAWTPRVDGRTFRSNAYACGVDVPGIVDVGMPLLAVPGLNGRTLPDGRVLTLGSLPLPLDAALVGRDGLTAMSLGIGGRAQASLLIENELVVGWGLLVVVSDGRPTLANMVEIGKIPFTQTTTATCPSGHDGRCYTAEAACPGLKVRVRALCSAEAKVKTATDLGSCLLDGLLLLDMPPTTTTTTTTDAGTLLSTDAGTTAPADAGTTTTADAGAPVVDAGVTAP